MPYWYVDTGMASLLILQTAVDEGLGACFFGVPGEYVDDLRVAFSIPADHTPVGAITVGHRDRGHRLEGVAGAPRAAYECGPPRAVGHYGQPMTVPASARGGRAAGPRPHPDRLRPRPVARRRRGVRPAARRAGAPVPAAARAADAHHRRDPRAPLQLARRERRATGRADGPPRRRTRRRRGAVAARPVRRRDPRKPHRAGDLGSRHPRRQGLRRRDLRGGRVAARGRAHARPRTSGCPSAATRRSAARRPSRRSRCSASAASRRGWSSTRVARSRAARSPA